jgi:hypothetical protein
MQKNQKERLRKQFREGGHEASPLAEGLLLFDYFWERESCLSLTMWFLVYQPHSRAGSMPRINGLTQTGLRGEREGRKEGRKEGRGRCLQNSVCRTLFAWSAVIVTSQGIQNQANQCSMGGGGTYQGFPLADQCVNWCILGKEDSAFSRHVTPQRLHILWLYIVLYSCRYM